MTNYDDLLSKLIYLDADFMSSKYEEIKKVSPETQFAKTEGMKADGGLAILTAGIHSQETKMFMLSSVKMLREIRRPRIVSMLSAEALQRIMRAPKLFGSRGN